ncbi:Nramp family divalent metal transporter [Tenacibaculum jejuense]|uniref:Putative integral membrane protein permease n=1 Tax=Tenacibaculum jejuense TaxID=584609 RepID=A0A238UBF3_9FLAO|nr:Nramp family divalent metal transporter [Tenacibaculum jejuense]SNR16306.1 putative integral membrane protein permease [Tenacibaculum jejuense]
MKKSILNVLGPGLLFAGAAIGVSHLVQATRAGADYGLGLLWAIIVVHLFKYPFFRFGPQYASATGESLLDGYKKLGKPYLILYMVVNFVTMFTIQAAVTIVTAGLASQLFGITHNLVYWSYILLIVIIIILLFGKYSFLDKFIKYIILFLTISTLLAVSIAFLKNESNYSFQQILPKNALEISFLIAFLGWMPAPLDISIWHSLWSVEKSKTTSEKITVKKSIFDFNVGYLGTLFLGICFILLGTLVMFNTGETFSSSGGKFAIQLIDLYTKNLGNYSKIIIGIAAFTTMFSTTITTLDASPRAMSKSAELFGFKKFNYWFWILFLLIGTCIILTFFKSSMLTLVKIATIFSFLTAPIFAFLNFKLITSSHTPKTSQPNLFLKIVSILGFIFLLSFSLWYLKTFITSY